MLFSSGVSAYLGEIGMIFLLKLWLWLIGIVFVIFSSYTLLYWIYSKKPLPVYKKKIFPTVSLVIPFFNEEIVLKNKIENTSKVDYPKDKLEIIFLNDHSTDKSISIIKKESKILPFKWRVINNKNNQGKLNALNYIFPTLKKELTMISDCDCSLERSALSNLTQNFQNKLVGGVSGRMIYSREHNFSNRDERLYRNLFDIWRQGESNIDSVSVANGPILLLKSELINDVVLGSQAEDSELLFEIKNKGYRFLYSLDALLYDITPPDSLERIKQKMRRARGLVHVFLKNFRMLGRGKFGTIIYPYALLTHVISPYLVLISVLIYLLLLFKNFYFSLFLIGFLIPKIGRIVLSFILTQSSMALSPFLAKGWNTAKSSRRL